MRETSPGILKISLVIPVLSSLLLSTSVFSSPWIDSDFISDSVTRANQSLSAKPQQELLAYRSLELDEYALKYLLSKHASSKTSLPLNEGDSEEKKLVLPLPDGAEVEVVATETSVLAPELALQFPNIKTWSVVGSNQIITGRVDFTLQGFHAMLVMPNGDTV